MLQILIKMDKIQVILLIFYILKTTHALDILPTDDISDLLKKLENSGLSITYNITTTSLPTEDEYDFIIIGAGSGGSTVANRLSEINKWKILLLEAGKVETLINEIPLFYAFTHHTDYNWGYKIEPQDNACFGMTNGQCTFPRGKALGGTSSINAMIYGRGNKLDYDLWASMGNEDWSFDKVLPYFIKNENFNIKETYNASYHGNNGYLCVQDVPYRTPLATAYLEAGKELGYKIVDYNGPEQIGFSYIQANMEDGVRYSAARAYLRVQRPNLDIVPDAFVTKILINDNNQAYGIEFIKGNVSRTVKARKEVILSAGSIDSTKLLMLSGIGPRDHLEELGIDVIKDAKVGYNLQEHVAFWLMFTVNTNTTIKIGSALSSENANEYVKNRDGPYSLPCGVESIAFIKTKYATDDRPDLELLFTTAAISSDNKNSAKPSYGISDEVYNKFFKPLESQHAFTVWPTLQHPKSNGRIMLRSTDPFDAPIIQPNFFEHSEDLEIVVEGIKLAIELSETESLRKFDTMLYNVTIPGCQSYEFGTDDYWRCAIKTLPALLNHEVGTVKMGPESDPDAVVDQKLRVYGIKGLRVIDGSVMPTIPVGHINGIVYMIGEKGADMIKEAWEDC